MNENREDAAVSLAKMTSKITFEDLPSNVLTIIKLDVLDTIATTLAGSAAQGVKEILSLFAEWGGKGESSILVYGDKLPSPAAALVNALQAHALDYDDCDDRGPVHCGSCVIPAALAIAERKGKVNGKAFCTALAIGTEIMCRMGAAPQRRHGFAVSSTMGYFGATAACGKLLNLTEEQMLHALGLAYAHTAGERQCVQDGALSKRLGRAGLVARGGVLSSLLAQKGITGATKSLEGTYGLYNVYYHGEYDREVLLSGLGDRWDIADFLGFKAFPCCSETHGPIGAALAVAKEHDIALDEVLEIVVKLKSETAYNTTCVPIKTKSAPRNTVDAQFSTPYTVAAALADKKVNIDTFAEQAIRRGELICLAQKVKPVLEENAVLDESIASVNRNNTGAKVEVVMKNGEIYRGKVDFRKGNPKNMMTHKEFVEKLYDCATYAVNEIPPANLENLISLVGELQQVDDISKLVDLVACPRK